MKKLMYLVMSIAMALFAANASAQSYLPTITSTACIVNGAGDIVTSGTLVIVGTDANDNPIPYRVNSSNQATTAPISRTITNGQLATSLQLANPTLTSPVGVLYRIVIQDNVTKKLTVYKQVIIAANSGSNYDLCIANLTPSTAAVITVTNPGTVNGNTIQNGDFTVNGRFVTTMQTITFSATPTFDCSLVAGGSFFKLTLTANVTSSTLSNCSNGQNISLELCQDATGSRTFVAPTNIQGFATIVSTASTCTVQFFIFDGGISKAIPDTITPLVSILNGVTFPASPSTHSVPVITASNTATYKVVPECTDGSSGQHLNYTQSTDTWGCGTSTPATLTGKTLATPVQGEACQGNCIAVIPGYASQVGKTTAVAATTLFTSGASDTLYVGSISVNCKVTSASATVVGNIIYTDVSNTVLTIPSTTATCTSLGATAQGGTVFAFQAKASTAVQYSTTIANTPTYDVRVAITQSGTN